MLTDKNIKLTKNNMEKYDEKESSEVKSKEKITTDKMHKMMKGHHSGSEQHVAHLKEHSHEVEEGY